MENMVIRLLVDYGALSLFAVFFYILFRWTLKHFEKEREEYQKIINDCGEREKNYQNIIAILSDKLPDMQETLTRIEAHLNIERG